ncbi:MAG: sigma-70 family RNA polymerase sigma factor [Chloroflexi bacterium]|nr:MAG: sigma-70 family RNA polymerase sigma factor [Chloroflexota bacterium]MBL1194110.1 sigma-70 family RNA polymerase sigma factor [Chloroflexota bacterium]NOH11403.1 sigma-70 family RNA polymerase sigma factor [Chloroflexota bacterium]
MSISHSSSGPCQELEALATRCGDICERSQWEQDPAAGASFFVDQIKSEDRPATCQAEGELFCSMRKLMLPAAIKILQEKSLPVSLADEVLSDAINKLIAKTKDKASPFRNERINSSSLYTRLVINSEVIDRVRRLSAQEKLIKELERADSLDISVVIGPSSGRSLEDTVHNTLAYAELEATLKHRLNKPQLRLVNWLSQGLKVIDIARKLGISKQAVYKQIWTMRDRLEDLNPFHRDTEDRSSCDEKDSTL